MRLILAIAFSLLVHFAAAGFLAKPFSPANSETIAEVSLIAHPKTQKIVASKGMKATKAQQSANENGNPEQTWPELLSQPTIDYPSSWKARQLSGVVRAKLRISSLGTVEEVQVLESKSDEMTELAEKAMRNFRFRPAMSDGQAIASEIEYSYRFVLR